MAECGPNSTLASTLKQPWSPYCPPCASCIPTCSSTFNVTNSSVSLTNSSADVSNYTFYLPTFFTNADLSITSSISTQNITVSSSNLGITVDLDDEYTLTNGIFHVEGCASLVDSTIVLNLTGKLNHTKTITLNLISDTTCINQSGVTVVVSDPTDTASGCSTSATLQNQQILLSVNCPGDTKHTPIQMPGIIAGTLISVFGIAAIAVAVFYIRQKELREETESFYRKLE